MSDLENRSVGGNWFRGIVYVCVLVYLVVITLQLYEYKKTIKNNSDIAFVSNARLVTLTLNKDGVYSENDSDLVALTLDNDASEFILGMTERDKTKAELRFSPQVGLAIAQALASRIKQNVPEEEGNNGTDETGTGAIGDQSVYETPQGSDAVPVE